MILAVLLSIGLFAGGASALAHETPAFQVWRGTSLNEVPRLGFLGPRREGRMVRIDLQVAGIGAPEASQACGAAVLFVYGAYGDVGQFRLVSERLRRVPIEQYYFDYDERGRRTTTNGADLAEAIVRFRRAQAATIQAARQRSGQVTADPALACRLVVIAHSMGGLVSRVALNHLAAYPRADIGQVEVITIDTPWPGYDGPSDQGLSSLMTMMATPFVPEGFMELRARSSLFDNLNRGSLPGHLSYQMFFATDSSEVLDYSEFPNTGIVPYLMARYQETPGVVPYSTPAIRNLWNAMVSSSAFPVFEREINILVRRRQLNEDQVSLLLERTFTHFEGTHAGVLVQHEQFAEYVAYDVARSVEEDLSR